MANMGNSGFRPFGPQGLFSTPQYSMPPGYPWGMPFATNEGFRPSATEMPFAHGQQTLPLLPMGQLIPQATMTQAEPTVHVEPHHEEQIYHSDSVMGMTEQSIGKRGLQYKYNTYLAPSRKELQSLTQKDKESFKEYAQRFIHKAAQIRPPLDERELSEMFYETLSPCYSEKMIVCASQKFTDLVETGIRIEDWARKGAGASGSSSGSSAPVYPNHPYIANITPQMTAPQNPNYQPPRPQGPSPYYPLLYQPPYNLQQFPQQPYYPQQPYQQRPHYPPQQQPRPQAPYNQ
ncbi:DNA translocase FtsK-like [Medicago truncatula]|uniref:DNA translocase FtsK-like n=1 Tax=Medicago truncatula TaxID=3880 RepID=UPI000D2F2CF9|nr:DNA translocase FtsK-like [Medicago truncatula]